MNGIAITFVLSASIALLSLPARWAALPLLAGGCYMTLGQGIQIGGLNFPVIRLLIAVGVLRCLVRGERPARTNALDGLMIAWAVWALVAAVFHENPGETLVNRSGLVYNACGTYFLLRCFCRSMDDVTQLCKVIAIMLVPLSMTMLVEQATGRNLFSVFGGVDEFSEVRGGSVRAQGPFAHSILAGSVGAACLPLMVVVWRDHRKTALAGIIACVVMVFCSASSGPLMSLGFGGIALYLWRYRRYMRLARWLAVVAYLLLMVVMDAPPYYLLARLDLTGSSTSWHRAELIDAAIRHFPEWWLVGTDYTRHWMPYGVSWSGNHVDITNYYINMAVYGGLPLMALFIAVLWKGFRYVGEITEGGGPKQAKATDERSRLLDAFLMWALGSSLFAHAATFMSVSYFDQSAMFLYITLALISVGYLSLHAEIREPVRPAARAVRGRPSTPIRARGSKALGFRGNRTRRAP